MVSYFGDSDDLDGTYENLAARNRVDGLLVTTAEAESQNLLPRMALQIPVVVVNRHVDDETSFAIVDVRAGARMAVEHLLELGHRRIAHLCGPLFHHNSAERAAGYR